MCSERFSRIDPPSSRPSASERSWNDVVEQVVEHARRDSELVGSSRTVHDLWTPGEQSTDTLWHGRGAESRSELSRDIKAHQLSSLTTPSQELQRTPFLPKVYKQEVVTSDGDFSVCSELEAHLACVR